MQRFIVYRLSNGKAYQTVECQPQFMLVDSSVDGFIPFVEGFDGDKHYVLQGALVARPTPAYTLEGNILKGVPAGAQVIIEGVSYTADGSNIELSFDMPGSYLVRVLSWPKQDWSISIEN